MLNLKSIAGILCGMLTISISNAQAPVSYSASELMLQLKKLNTVGSVLYIAAHPDDENTRLIAYLANEKCLRTGYLSLTRGDGGQNLIGPEQGRELGMIRTQELLAARRIDGGEQFFTRAYDFGFSKTPVETFHKWNHEQVLADVVWVIRNFRPDVIITRFATDGSGGHGHHTASAMLAEEAFDAAADPNRFPEQLKVVNVWQTRRLFWNVSTRFSNPNADMSPYIKLDVGGYNTLLGKTYGEISAESRSMHKSQGFGSARQRGEYLEYFKPIKGDTIGLKDIFDGINFTWSRYQSTEAQQTGKLARELMDQFNPNIPFNSLSKFESLYESLRQVKPETYHRKLMDKLAPEFYGFFHEMVGQDPLVSQDGKMKMTYTLVNKHAPEVYLESFTKLAGAQQIDTVLRKSLMKNKVWTYTFEAPFNPSANPVFQPLQLQDTSADYWVLKTGEQVAKPFFAYERGRPENNEPIGGVIQVLKAENAKNFPVPIRYKRTDPEKGECYQPLVVTPPVMVNVSSPACVFSSEKPQSVTITVKAGRDSVNGWVMVKVPEGWFFETAAQAPGKMQGRQTDFGFAFTLMKKGEILVQELRVTPPAKSTTDDVRFFAKVNGVEYDQGIKQIAYDHIPTQTWFPKATLKLVRLDVKRKAKRIGYIPGAGDEVQGCLTQLGYEVVTLTDEMLAKGDLSTFQAIVTGVRAYNTNDKLSEVKSRLMDYVKAGGNLVVQYNTNSFAGPLKADIGPYKFKLTRDRITDEEATVKFELPQHPVLNVPNKITEADFQGWIQERSIYHGGEWDSNYVAPISMQDPGEQPNKGALLIAKVGKGHFVYTGLVFFRELPAGVPGAYRLFVNMLELGLK